MRKIISIILVFTIAFMMTGCISSFKVEIKSPSTKTIIEGQWKVKEYTSINEDHVSDCTLTGSVVSFSNEEVFMFERAYNNITYKAKVVNGKDYIYNTIGFIPQDIELKDEDIIVVTISTNNTYLKDIIVNGDNMLIIQDDIILNLERISDTPIANTSYMINSTEEDEGHKDSSGVLLGLKAPSDEGFIYKTLWITYDGKNIASKELPYILLPRKNGFLKVDNNRIYNEDRYYDNIEFSFLNGTIKQKEEVTTKDSSSVNREEDITFIGNDYMSVRTVEHDEEYSKEWLNTFLTDMNNSEEKVSVDLGKISDQRSIKDLTISNPNQSHDIYIKDINTFTNFAIERIQGRWAFFTLDSKKTIKDNSTEDEEEGSVSSNIEIPLRVSNNIARHDELFIPWQGIKNEVPAAIDAISSPNKNMAIIKTKSNLYVYKINNNKLEKEPELTIPLEGYENVIMAEWAMAEYVGYWTEEVDTLLKDNK
ncbi:hypothetical protein [Clostridium sp.]|uniref:hypothetical protein n=1 Tax=Clostridium sp. TaxID=1506 RepID=UPI003216211A